MLRFDTQTLIMKSFGLKIVKLKKALKKFGARVEKISRAENFW